MAWVHQLHAKRAYVRDIPPRFGWYFSEGKIKGFSLLGTTYYTDGTVTQTSVVRDGMATTYTPRGNQEYWQKAVNYIMKHDDRPGVHVLIATAFAAPLVMFSGQSGMVLSAVSHNSGVGKSTALKLAQAVWGDPVRGVNALDDTPMSVANKLGVINNLPAYWDELRGRDEMIAFLKLAFQLGQGKEKTRLSSDIAMRPINTWSTLLTVATNEPLYDYIHQGVRGTNAGYLRTFEFYIRDMGKGQSWKDVNELTTFIGHNYGQAGLIYVKWLVANVDKIQPFLDRTRDRMIARLNPTQDERFWLATIVCLLAGASIAKVLGLVSFDLKLMEDYLVGLFADHRLRIKDEYETPFDFIAGFLETHQDRRLVTDTMPAGVGKPKTCTVEVEPRSGKVSHQIASKDNKLRISMRELRRYFNAINVSFSNFKNEVVTVPGVELERGTLGSGTKYSGLRSATLEIDLTVAPFDTLVPLLDFVEEQAPD